jgi:predicted nucleic acid-binding protein
LISRGYFDTSVVVAYYLPEPLSGRVQEIYENILGPEISELVEVEVVAALSLRLRVGDIRREQAERVAGLFTDHLEEGLYVRRHLHAGHYRLARDFIARFDLPLKSPDALHLAICAAEDLSLFTADRQLARNAEALSVDFELVEP